MGKGWGFKLVMGGERWGDGRKGVGLQVQSMLSHR